MRLAIINVDSSLQNASIAAVLRCGRGMRAGARLVRNCRHRVSDTSLQSIRCLGCRPSTDARLTMRQSMPSSLLCRGNWVGTTTSPVVDPSFDTCERNLGSRCRHSPSVAPMRADDSSRHCVTHTLELSLPCSQLPLPIHPQGCKARHPA